MFACDMVIVNSLEQLIYFYFPLATVSKSIQKSQFLSNVEGFFLVVFVLFFF